MIEFIRKDGKVKVVVTSETPRKSQVPGSNRKERRALRYARRAAVLLVRVNRLRKEVVADGDIVGRFPKFIGKKRMSGYYSWLLHKQEFFTNQVRQGVSA